ncbi:MAG: hypothetical protein E5Y10_24565 [Mesorhizobium sp.]|nr:MAG: hypothetical protein E5Y10_24565 [Mesorhizobium sp.]
MAEDDEPPLTEPIVVQDVFCEGVDLERINGEVRLIGWVTHQDEHRIVARLVLPDGIARALARDLRKITAGGSN